MSLAHLRVTKVRRARTPAGAAAPKGASPAAFCGASHEPIYRTMDEAAQSGLQLCDSCLVDFRRQRKTL